MLKIVYAKKNKPCFFKILNVKNYVKKSDFKIIAHGNFLSLTNNGETPSTARRTYLYRRVMKSASFNFVHYDVVSRRNSWTSIVLSVQSLSFGYYYYYRKNTII